MPLPILTGSQNGAVVLAHKDTLDAKQNSRGDLKTPTCLDSIRCSQGIDGTAEELLKN